MAMVFNSTGYGRPIRLKSYLPRLLPIAVAEKMPCPTNREANSCGLNSPARASMRSSVAVLHGTPAAVYQCGIISTAMAVPKLHGGCW
jgi:hypothetical protein